MSVPRTFSATLLRAVFPGLMAILAACLLPALAEAQPVPPDRARPSSAPVPARVQSVVEALSRDAKEYALAYGVDQAEAVRRLRAQEQSVAATDEIQRRYKERLAGIAIEHVPAFHILVLLTGDEPVADTYVRAGGMDVPILFRTGAPATHDALVAAIRQHQAEIRSRMLHPPGLGINPRTGALVVMLADREIDPSEADQVKLDVEKLTGMKVEVRISDRPDDNLSVEGGSRVHGMQDGRRFVCTSGFVVTDGASKGVATAAHCPDSLVYVDPNREEVLLDDFVGQWGWAYRDVQIHRTDRALEPLFYSDSAKSQTRPVTSWRNRTSTRAGDMVCHRGESTGYSCAEVETVDFAPPGDLCGGPCDPTWVMVAGPACKAGDSGSPVFLGTIAFGLVKGGSHRPDGTCNYYYYMSTDYLPEGWSLLYRR